MQLSKNFHIRELTYSNTAMLKGIDNTLKSSDLGVINALNALVKSVLQPLRDKVNTPIVINSGYRSVKLNTAVGGKFNSQHLKGEAADIVINGYAPIEVAKTIVSLGLPYDQLIVYNTFVHVSHSMKSNRKQLLYNSSYNGKRI